MIKNGTYTTYMGKEYIVYRGNLKGEKYFRIRSNSLEDLNLGFRLSDNGVSNCYIKDINPSEVGEVYHINTLAEYKNVTVAVIGENDTQYLLYIGDEIGNGLGFENIGRSEYQKWINKEDVANVHEVKRPASNFFGS